MKVKHIAVFTNGMTLPNAELVECLRHEKVEVVLSDYGNLLQMANFVDFLEQSNVRFTIRSDLQWINFGDTRKRGKTREQIAKDFGNCSFSGNCKALLEDKLFVCERAARMHMLGSVYNSSSDYSLLRFEVSDKEIRNCVSLLYHKNAADACDYCDAGSEHPPYVPVGKQINETYRTSKYTIVERAKLIDG